LDQLTGLVVKKQRNATLTERHHHLVGHADAHLRHVTQTASMRSDVEYSSNLTYGSWH
jgi:hypothetical protein